MFNLSDKQIIDATVSYGSPLYLYDASSLSSCYEELRSAMPKSVDVFYSMKANPLLGICQMLRSYGSCCEVCSECEFQVAIKAGFSPKDIIFVGPAKTRKELSLCIEHNIYAVVCESFAELEILNDLAKEYESNVNILVRINPEFAAANAPLKMGGKPTQFGIDWLELEKRMDEFVRYSNLNLLGIHIYNGSRILCAETIIENTENILNLAEDMMSKLNIEFECVDIGGGIGVPYFKGEQDIDIDMLRDGMHRVINKYINKYPSTRIILEAGRRLVAKSGVMVSKVDYIKESHNENFLITDGGMNCHMAASGTGSFMKRNFPTKLISINRNSSSEKHVFNITGPLCTPGDTIAKKIELPKAEVGDLVIIKSSGAYGPSASPVRFLSHGFPAEAMIDGKDSYLLRKRESVADMLVNQFNLSHI